MIEQLKTIRDALLLRDMESCEEALTALDQLEAMVKEPYGTVTVVRKPGCADMHWFYRWPAPPYLDNAAECHTVYTAAPPAQQPLERAQTLVEAFNDCDATHAGDLGYRSKQPQAEAVDWKAQYEHQKRRAERWIAKYEADIGPLEKAGPVAQQPQEIEVQCPVCNHKFYEWPNDKQPQAEAVPTVQVVNCDTCKHSANSCDDYPCNRCGVEFGDGPFNRWEAPQQAKRASNTVQSTQALIDAGIPFESHNGGTHIVIKVGSVVYDFWPSTGLWWLRPTKTKHRGVFRLIQTIAAQGAKT